MGLVLYNQADGDPLSSRTRPQFDRLDSLDDQTAYDACLDGSLPSVLDHRHLPPSGRQIHDWRHGPSKARLTQTQGRQLAWTARYLYDSEDGRNVAFDGADETVASRASHSLRQGSDGDVLHHFSPRPRCLRPHQVALLQRTKHVHYRSWYDGHVRLHAKDCRRGDSKPHVRSQRQWARSDLVDGIDRQGQRAGCTTSSTKASQRRPPSLERQGAFRAASTSRTRSSSTATATPATCPDIDADEAELYRLGILYDDEYERGSGFDLNAIVHDTPVYHMQTRQRRRRAQPSTPLSTALPSPLSLDLSFSNLSDDRALARLLQDSEMAEFLAAEEAACNLFSSPPAASSSQQRDAVMTVIYELAEDSPMDGHAPDQDLRPSFDAFTDDDRDSNTDSEWLII